MANANEQVVRDAVAAMQKGDMDGLGATLDENVVLHVPGSNQISGDYNGRAAFFEEFLGKIMGLTGGQFQIEPHDWVSNDQHVIGLYNMSAGREGKQFGWSHVNVYHVRDGKVAEIWQHPGDVKAWNDFWS
jgi:ketosteroid isomerase-like protein